MSETPTNETPTNLSDLVLRCDSCGYLRSVIDVIDIDPEDWPQHCCQPMRVTNTTDRDGRPT